MIKWGKFEYIEYGISKHIIPYVYQRGRYGRIASYPSFNRSAFDIVVR